jgi:hypothetical protein
VPAWGRGASLGFQFCPAGSCSVRCSHSSRLPLGSAPQQRRLGRPGSTIARRMRPVPRTTRTALLVPIEILLVLRGSLSPGWLPPSPTAGNQGTPASPWPAPAVLSQQIACRLVMIPERRKLDRSTGNSASRSWSHASGIPVQQAAQELPSSWRQVPKTPEPDVFAE